MRIKYMGSADVARIKSGYNFGGRLANTHNKTVEWNRDNHWIIDTDEEGVSDSWVALVLEDTDRFKDVTGLDRIPANQHQSIFLGMSSKDVNEELAPPVDAADSPDVSASSDQTVEEQSKPDTKKAPK